MKQSGGGKGGCGRGAGVVNGCSGRGEGAGGARGGGGALTRLEEGSFLSVEVMERCRLGEGGWVLGVLAY